MTAMLMKKKKFVIIFLALQLTSISKTMDVPGLDCNDPKCFATTAQLIKYYGYPLEEHYVTTSDNYILGLQRIPNGINECTNQCQNPKPAVLLLHGVFRGSSIFVVTPPEYNLGCNLADAGFDVWLGNLRGTPSSRRNTEYNITEDGFWNFRFDEVALNDVSAFIDYIIKVTKNPKISYIGHSQGTTVFLALLSGKPSYNKKISGAFLMAPNAVLSENNEANGEMFGAKSQEALINFFAPTEAVFPTVEGFYSDLASGKCSANFAIQFLCGFATPNYTGDPNVDQSQLSVYFSLYPTSVSAYELKQVFQILYSNRLQKFDYGSFGNSLLYYSSVPTPYDLSKITVPVSLYSSESDTVSSPLIVDYIRERLPNIKTDVTIPIKDGVGFSHIAFVLSKTAKELVYDDIIETIRLDNQC